MMEDYDLTNGFIHLTANPHWTDWGGHAAQKFTDIYFEFKPNKEIALSELAAGTIDMVDAQFSLLIDEIPLGASYSFVKDGGYQELAINCLHPYLGTGELCPISSPESGKYVRQAINHMFPRDAIANEIWDGHALPGVTPFSQIGVGYDNSLEPYEYSIEIAKSCMEAAGFVYDDIPTSSPPPTTPTTPTTPTSTPPTITVGIPIGTVIGILALLGGSIAVICKRKNE